MYKVGEKIETFVCDMMTSYRWVPLLATLAKDDVDDATKMIAWLDLTRLLREKLFEGSAAAVITHDMEMTFEEAENYLRKFIDKNKNWIMYSLLDMGFYVNDLVPFDDVEKARMEAYPHRMAEQAKFLRWFEGGFTLPIQCLPDAKILDIGCGTMPYTGLFDVHNQAGSVNKYLGLDKKDMRPFLPEGEIIKPYNIMFEQLDICTADIRNIVYHPDVIFFGESLHCLCIPIPTLKKLCDYFGDTLKVMMFLEPNLNTQSGLSTAFPFHMKLHADGMFVNTKTISNIAMLLGMNMSKREASSQHTMYVLERRI